MSPKIITKSAMYAAGICMPYISKTPEAGSMETVDSSIIQCIRREIRAAAFRASFIACGKSHRLLLRRTISADSSAQEPSNAMDISAIPIASRLVRLSAMKSVPEPCDCSMRSSRTFSMADRDARVAERPRERPAAFAVEGLSPVSSTVFMSILMSEAMAAGVSSRRGSLKAMKPRPELPVLRNRTVLPREAI